MKNVANTIEDLLEILAGLQGQSKIQIESSDTNIMYSIARQVFKGTALTDRQQEVMKEKLLKYKDQFTALEYDFDSSIETLRMPLRHIDRSKFIKIVNHPDMVGPNGIYESYKSDWCWIKVRFPFSKKLIVKIEEILNKTTRRHYHHDKGSHEHFFFLNERNIYEVINAYKDSNFEIQYELLEAYNKAEEIINNPDNYIPGIYNLKLKNLHERTIEYIVSTIGKPTIENLVLYKDRQEVFGLHHFDQQDLDFSISRFTTLSKKIVNRTSTNVLVKPSLYNINQIAESFLELDRFPLLVVLSETDPLDELHQVHSALKGFIDKDESSVLFRLDNTHNSHFNDYIKNNNLNARLDKTTKVVYISNNKVPKPLLYSEWQYTTALLLSSIRSGPKNQAYLNQTDLVIHYDENMSQFMRFQKEGIQEL